MNLAGRRPASPCRIAAHPGRTQEEVAALLKDAQPGQKGKLDCTVDVGKGTLPVDDRRVIDLGTVACQPLVKPLQILSAVIEPLYLEGNQPFLRTPPVDCFEEILTSSHLNWVMKAGPIHSGPAVVRCVIMRREVAQNVKPPRTLFVHFPLGAPLGPANEAEVHRTVRQALDVLVTAQEPATIVDSPLQWKRDRGGS